MMTSPRYQLQKAIVQRLKADGQVAAHVQGRIYDDVPEDAEFPYISIGAVAIRSRHADCLDLVEVTFQLDVWSRAAGLEELSEISEAVCAALHDADLELETHACIYLLHEQTHEMYDPDGETTHAVLSFEATIERV